MTNEETIVLTFRPDGSVTFINPAGRSIPIEVRYWSSESEEQRYRLNIPGGMEMLVKGSTDV